MTNFYHIPRLMIAAPKGASGKTLFTIGLVALLKEQGFKVSVFKKGPDYIDAGWLTKISGSYCRNLDLFLFDEERNLHSFYEGSYGADLAVIEGNRGLYDGVDLEGSCSTASLAKLLKSPVILVVDCTKATRSIAALVKGFVEFDPEVPIKGVILNHIVRSRHENLIRAAIERYTNLPVLGVIPRLKESVKERHLGLVTSLEEDLDFVEEILNKLRDNLDLSSLLSIAKAAPPIKIGMLTHHRNKNFDLKVGVFYDPAFQFYYPENLEALSHLGAKLIFINSLQDTKLPEIDALYLGGGFPEVQAERLADNWALRKEVKEFAEMGLPIYAECGGLMYLGEEIEWQGKKYPMTGLLPIKFKVDKRPRGHGYVVAKVAETNPFYPEGALIRGHEFHYSYPASVGEKKGMKLVLKLEKGTGFKEGFDGVTYKNIFAAYTHIHTFSVKYWANNFLSLAEKIKNT